MGTIPFCNTLKRRKVEGNTWIDSKLIPVSKITPTCWQMLAYRARTLAFSKMASSDGVVLLIFSTQRHLAKSAPSFLYCAQRSDSPSRPALQHGARHQKQEGASLARQYSKHLTLSGCLSICASEGDNTFVHLWRQDRKRWIELLTTIMRESSPPRGNLS